MTLDRLGRQFVRTLNGALNGSVTDGVRLRYIGRRDGSLGWVGYDISREDLTSVPFPLGIGRAPPKCWLRLQQTLELDDEGDGYLKTVRATMAVHTSEVGDDRDQLLRYDFNRDQEGGFPAAHLQIFGRSEPLDALNDALGRRVAMHRLHLPVGGVRFRPCLEDVVEFLILEGFVEPRDGWHERLDRSRTAFHAVQLKAAVRNDPQVAAEQLEEMGWGVMPPDTG